MTTRKLKNTINSHEEADIAIIVPAYNEGEGLVKFYDAVSDTLNTLNCDYLITFVNDGSSDNTWDIIEKLSQQHSTVIGLSFSRNFGKEYAVFAGLSEVEASHYLVMDSDLQHPPSFIPEFWTKMREGNVDVVEGIKSNRGKESYIYKFCSNLFYTTLNALSGQNLKNSSDFKLFTKRFRNAVLDCEDGSFFFRGACEWVGFPKIAVEFSVGERVEGESKFSFKALLGLMNNAILSNTKTLLRLSTFVGILFGIFSIVLAIIAIFDKVSGIATSGFTTVILFLSIQACFLFLSLGILGEYLARIYKEVKKYPSYIIGRRTDD